MHQFPQAPEYPIGVISNFTKIRRDSHNFMFIAVVVDTGDKLFTGVNDTSDKLLPVTLLLAINYRLTPVIKPGPGLFINGINDAGNN
jgi:hypothetical protein